VSIQTALGKNALMPKILVIDDDKLFCKAVVTTLRREGYDVKEAGGGAAGLALAFSEQPNLILCDVNMAGQNGFAVLKELRGHPETAAIPVIMMTGEPQKADARFSMEQGADDYLAKPFAMEVMLTAVQGRLQRHVGIRQALAAPLPKEYVSPAEKIRQAIGDKGLLRQMSARGFQNIFRVVLLAFAFALVQMFVLQRVCNTGMKAATALNREGLPNLNHLASLREQIALFRLYSYERLFVRENARAQQALDAEVAEKNIRTELGEIKKLLRDPTGRQLTAALDTAFDDLAEEYARMRELLDKDFAKSMKLMDEELPPKIQRVSEAELALEQFGYQFSGAQTQASFDGFNEIKQKVFMFGAANLAVMLGLVLFVLLAARRTSGQLAMTLDQLNEQSRELHLQTSALEAAANGIAITDREGSILWVNHAFTQLTGYAAKEAVGLNPCVLNSGRQQPEFSAAMWEQISSGHVWQGELVNQRKDGSSYFEEMTITPVCGTDGAIRNFIAIKQDISERKRIEQALAHKRDLLQALMDNLPDHIYFKDLDSRFTRINLAQARHLGLANPEEAIGKSDADFFPGGDARQKLVEERCLMTTGNPLVDLVEKSDTANGPHWVSSTKVPIRGPDGKINGLVGISRDITASKQADQERQRMELQLRQSQKLESVGQLAAGIAHEINTPTQYVGDNTRFVKDSFAAISEVLQNHAALLTAAKQNSITPELLARSEALLAASDLEYLCEQIPAALRESLEGVERVTNIVRAMKEFSHPGGKEKTPADLNKAIESTTTVARNTWKYVADLKLELAPDLPAVPCFLGEFNQCVLNLVVNAAHAIGDVVKQNPGTKGLITVQTRRDSDFIEVRVTDTGTGIAEANRQKIFEPFFTTKDVGKGTGQGLAMIYGCIVKQHGGTVTFETEVGRGTTFILRLPLKPQSGTATGAPLPPEITTA
jgi:PAS domain S-box-containing protein